MVSAPTDLPTAREREIARQGERLAVALAARGHEVVVHTRRVDATAPDEERLAPGATLRHVTVGPARELSEDELSAALNDFGRALAAEWRSNPPDVVHAYSWTSGLAVSAARRQLRESALIGGGASAPPVPAVLTFTGFGSQQRHRDRSADSALANRIRLEVALARSVEMMVAGSDDEIEELSRMGVPRNRIRLVPRGIDVERFSPNGPSAHRPDTPRVLALGEAAPVSGLETMIAALRGLPGVELVILPSPADGRPGGDELARLRSGAAALGVADRVVFVEEEAGPEFRPTLLRSADAVVCVPWSGPVDAGPVLEAMACGVPLVVTGTGALTDVVVDGVTGVHVAPRRPDQLATAIRALLGDPVRRLGFGVAGADRARSRYEWARLAADAERVYATLVPVAPAEDARPEDARPEDAVPTQGADLIQATD